MYKMFFINQYTDNLLQNCTLQSVQLPGYIDVTQTVFVILTMAGIFPDRPH